MDCLEKRLDVSAVSPLYGMLRGVSGCCIFVTENLDRSRFNATCWLAGSEPAAARRPTVRLAIPPLAFRAFSKFGARDKTYLRLVEWRYERALRPGSIAWVWPNMSARLLKNLKRRGHVVILERINSSVRTARQLLDAAGTRLGLPAGHNIDEHAIADEAQDLEAADYIFVCSPFVEDSFLRTGVPAERIRRCTYGWDPDSFKLKPRDTQETLDPIFLFVGSGCLRKGLPDLLEAWNRANIRGRLRIIGPIEKPIAKRYAHVLSRADVEPLGYQRDLAQQYSQAHVFVLPSLEEGSPLVTYMALAAGIPSLVSLPGAGGIVHDDVEGLVRDPNQQSDFQDALVRLATDADLRDRLGRAAARAAPQYTWQRVAQTRAEVFSSIARTF
jgi:glycosyltransferase involved in cell wall biosynthesis